MTSSSASLNRVHKSSSSGTTHRIREQLNFTDERRWKRFSGRRLELIDKFGLSERKASEQDDNIRQIATILRTEFGYPAATAGEFEKLVTAAVQSVRRNRKRSCKSRPTAGSRDELPAGGGGAAAATAHGAVAVAAAPSAAPSAASSPASEPARSLTPAGAAAPPQLSQQQPLPALPSATAAGAAPPVRVVARTSGPEQLPPLAPQNYDELVKAVIGDAVHNRVALHEQSRQDDASPNLADFAMSVNDGSLLSLALSSNRSHDGKHQISRDDRMPFFLREKILLHIQRSRTCFEVASSQGSLELYANLEILGETSIKSSVAFVMERFFSNLSASSMEYITSKLCSPQELAKISVKLFGPATERQLDQMARDAQLKVFFLVMGGIVKDFGFDPCVYPLSEIMHDVIVRHYPLVCHPCGDSKRTTIMSTLSMVPAAANKDVYRNVLLKFKDKEQHFTFHLLSNGPPTTAEILQNSRHLFQIVSQTKSLHLKHNGAAVRDDMELARIFNRVTREQIVIEICEMKQESFDGLNILSSVSASAPPELTKDYVHTDRQLAAKSRTTSSSTAYSSSDHSVRSTPQPGTEHPQNSMPRISSLTEADGANGLTSSSAAISNSPPVVRANHQSKGLFDKGSLPQPVFQPLL